MKINAHLRKIELWTTKTLILHENMTLFTDFDKTLRRNISSRKDSDFEAPKAVTPQISNINF